MLSPTQDQTMFWTIQNFDKSHTCKPFPSSWTLYYMFWYFDGFWWIKRQTWNKRTCFSYEFLPRICLARGFLTESRWICAENYTSFAFMNMYFIQFLYILNKWIPEYDFTYHQKSCLNYHKTKLRGHWWRAKWKVYWADGRAKYCLDSKTTMNTSPFFTGVPLREHQWRVNSRSKEMVITGECASAHQPFLFHQKCVVWHKRTWLVEG